MALQPPHWLIWGCTHFYPLNSERGYGARGRPCSPLYPHKICNGTFFCRGHPGHRADQGDDEQLVVAAEYSQCGYPHLPAAVSAGAGH